MGCTPSSKKASSTAHSPSHSKLAAADQGEIVPRKRNHSTSSGVSIDLYNLQREKCKDLDNGWNHNNSSRMRLHNRMNILLVFAKADAQCSTLVKAAEKCNCSYEVVHSSEGALEAFVRRVPHITFIDCRSLHLFDPKSLCRSMLAVNSKCQTTFVAVTKKSTNDKMEANILPLLNAGFTRKFVETVHVENCQSELVAMEQGEVKVRQQLSACSALVTALQSVHEAVEILDKHLKTEFVNFAFEKMTGYSAKDLIGKDNTTRLSCDNANGEDDISSYLKSGKMWSGSQCLKKKGGEVFTCKCKLVTLEASNGLPGRHVIVRWFSQEPGQIREVEHTHSVNGLHYRRKESRYHTKAAIETPISRVINIISDAQASSPSVGVVQALDKVLEILQSSDLFSTQIQRVKEEEDPMTSDLVGALVETHPGQQQYPPSKSPGALTKAEVCQEKLLIAMFSQEVQRVLDNAMSWTFNILELEKITNYQPLTALGMKIFSRFNVCRFLSIDERTLYLWLEKIQSAYRSTNSYHTASHAADVMQATAYFLESLRPKAILDQGDEVAALIAAVIHDVDHPGKTSSFLINARDPLAVLYNDISVLENHHSAYGFQLTVSDDKTNIFKNLSREEYENLRSGIIDMVLATDMAKHFEHLSKFVHICNSVKLPDESFSQKSTCTATSEVILNSPESKKQIKRMIVKCADVSNPSRELPVCIEWAERIAEEYFCQADEERKKGMPVVMPHFVRGSCCMPLSQVKFIEVFLLSMFEHWNSFVDVPEVCERLQDNYRYWQEMHKKEKAGQQPS